MMGKANVVGPGPTHEANPPRTFRERLQALAGSSTWREPMEAHGTKGRSVPAAHELAAALGMARRYVQHGDARMPDPMDVGPDIAIDVVLGRTSNAGRVIRTVAAAMGSDRARAVQRCKPWLRIVVWAGYYELVHGQPLPMVRPSEVAPDDWALLTDAALRIMEQLADEAVGRAARKWRRAA